MDTVNRLLLDSLIPPSVHQKHICAIVSGSLLNTIFGLFSVLTVSHRQIETNAASLERYKQNQGLIRFAAELFNGASTLRLTHSTVKPTINGH